MLRINNTFLEINSNKFYKVIDKLDNIDYYLLVRTQDNPNSGAIQFVICTGLREIKNVDRIPTYGWDIGHSIDNFQEVSKLWKGLSMFN